MSDTPAAPFQFIKSPLQQTLESGVVPVFVGENAETNREDFLYDYKAPLRPGDFGYHQTHVGKIVYQRKRHFFTRKDWERIGKRYLVSSEEAGGNDTPDKLWWQRVLEDYTLKMMDELFRIPPFNYLDVEPSELYYNIQQFGSDMGMAWANSLAVGGKTEAAEVLRELFVQRK